jgi:hypothetical protein
MLQCGSARVLKVRKGPLTNGEGWYDTIDACNCAESMELAFANKLEIWARYALSQLDKKGSIVSISLTLRYYQ